MGNKSAQRQFLVNVNGLQDTFAQKSGGDITAEANKVYDGGSLTPDIIAGPQDISNISVSRAYDYQRDGALLKWLRARVGNWRTSLTVTPANENLVALGNPAIYPDCLLIGLTEPEMDAGSGDGATYSLEFLVPRVK